MQVRSNLLQSGCAVISRETWHSVRCSTFELDGIEHEWSIMGEWSIVDACLSCMQGVLSYLHIYKGNKVPFGILKDVSGVIKPVSKAPIFLALLLHGISAVIQDESK